MDRNSKEFKDLEALWKKKLEASGFDDIEQDEDRLKVWSKHFFIATFDATKYEAKKEYYRLAGQFLHEYEFQSEKDRLIWYYHSEGISIRDITVIMKKRRYKVHTRSVNQAIQRLTQVMVSTCWTKQT